MCVACIEYLKDKLNEKEFKSALVEMTMEDKKHWDEINRAIEQNANNPEKLKQAIDAISKR